MLGVVKTKKIIVILGIIATLIIGAKLISNILIRSEDVPTEKVNVMTNSDVGNVVHREEISDYVAKTEYGTHVNTSGKMQSTKKYKGLELSNVNLETLENRTVMLIDVKNTTKETVNEKTVKVDLLTKDNKTIVTLTGTLQTVEPGKTVQLNLEIEGDYTDVYDYKIYE